MFHTPQSALKAMYICRGCGAEVAYPDRYTKCPVCGIKWG
ncbi:hydrogenase maturation nickel metallochaperone HypA [Gordonia mangrovi]|nr:hydrogenase maturation nickel metallochaperone HypA [Gordonia mangrovi]UVF79170.1 hydrogenase maturation nickel metallochaperone HypA [Gordonia mangrovi]